jgi:UDP-N-acetylmuramoyl-tripeptide--D-alanyl-D-alanine ligase
MKPFLKKIIVRFIQFEAILVLKKYKPHIIAVTGSVGKTSTKDAIFAVMSSSFFVRKSEKSFNSDIGVPLTILGCKNAWNNPFLWVKNIVEGIALIVLKNHYPKWLVLEVGADRPGDIKAIARWLKPDVVVVTRFPDVPVHVEYFDSPEDVIAEKEELVKALKPGGHLILNGDDEKVLELKERYRHATIVTFGFGAENDVVISREGIEYKNGAPSGMSFRVDAKGSSVPVHIADALGKQHIYPAVAGLAVGAIEGLDLVAIGGALSSYTTSPGRMHIIEGINHTTIIDDSYNSSPIAAQEALKVLAELSVQGRKIAVLGDMMELGVYSVEEHKKLGEMVAQDIDILLVVGIRARGIATRAREKRMKKSAIFEYTNSNEAGEALKEMLEEGDCVLVKGSQSTRMERVVKEVMASPERAEELLVRQDAEWLNRD